LVTIAPEMDGALEAVRRFTDAGAVASIGHTDASEADYERGREAGITHATHLFNAMPSHDRMAGAPYEGVRQIGVEDLVLADPDISVDIVVDSPGVHVHRALLRIALACLGDGRLSLITDAMSAAGLPAGTHARGDGEPITTADHEDVARLSDGRLTGSAMMINGAISNLTNRASVPIETALRMATQAPARALGIDDRKGSLAPGMDADLVVLDVADDGPRVSARHVVIAGRDVVVDGRPTAAPQDPTSPAPEPS
jgi:N-acetylglucosamine-6-phosphate deacetylase